MKHNKKAEIDMKSIMIGLLFIVLVASLFSIMLTSFATKYDSDLNGSTALLETISSKGQDYNETIIGYSDQLFEPKDSTILDYVQFMWKGAWAVMKQTASLPSDVLNIARVGMTQIGVPNQVQAPIILFIISILTLIIVFAVIFKIKGST